MITARQLSYCIVTDVAILLTSCDVHEFPRESTTEPTIDHTLTMTFDSDEFDHLVTLETGNDGRGRAASDAMLTRHIVRAYRHEPAGTTGTRVTSRAVIDYYEGTENHDGNHPDVTLPLKLEAGEYDIMAWSEHVPADGYAGGDYFHDTHDFYELTLNGIGTQEYTHIGNTHMRAAWRGLTHITIEKNGEVHTDASDTDIEDVIVEMKRPMARFHFITTDLQEFNSRVMGKGETSHAPETGAPQAPRPDDYRIVVKYTGFMPSAYNLLSDKPIDSTAGVSFDGQFTPIDENTAELAFDYVLVNGSSTSVQVALELYRRSDGALLSSTGVIDVPLKRGHYTVIKGPMLTTSTGNGVGIIPGYDGDYNIEIH